MGSKEILLRALKHHGNLVLLMTDNLGKGLAELISERFLVHFQCLVLT